MTLRRTLTHALAAVLVTGALVTPTLAAAPAGAAEAVLDGGFEASVGDNAPTSEVWTQFDSAFPNVICVIGGNCGEDGLTIKPRSGTHWAYFGGVDVLGHNSFLQQTVRITPNRAVLSYWYLDGFGYAPFDSVLRVLIDGQLVNQHREQDSPPTEYAVQTVDVSGFADGGLHVLRFEYANPDALASFFQIDDVSLVASDTIAPETSATGPAGGIAKSLTVPISFGSPEAGTTFACSLDGGAYAACTSPRVFQVSSGAHTVRVAAADASGNTDASPAVVAFTAYDCASLKQVVVKAKKKVKRLKKALRAAKADDLDGKVDRLEKKLKKAKKRLAKAKAAYQPCR